MNLRLTVTAAIAVIAASLSLNAVVGGNGWLVAGIGAVICAALAGTLTRVSGVRLAIAGPLLVAIVIMPMFTSSSWYPRIGALAVVAIAVGAALVSRLRWITVLATYLAVLLIYLNLVFASARSFALVIPTSNSLAFLSRLPHYAFAEFKFSPPVPDIRAVSFFAAAGIGLIAISVDIIAVWLRRPAIAGLPLLALFSVPVASNLKGFGLGQSITFAVGLAGFLLLLASESRERLRMWGRLVTFRYTQPADEAGPGPDTREIAASGRRIGLAAVCLAIVVPLILPTMHVHDIFAGPGNGQGSGSGGGTGPVSPLLQVQTELTEKKAQTVLTYTTNAAQPDYLQEYALNYSAKRNEWLPAGGHDQPINATKTSFSLPAPVPGLSRGVKTSMVTTSVRMASGDVGLADGLPVPYAPVKLDTHVPAGWLENPDTLTLSSDSAPLANLSYTVTSEEVDPTNPELEVTAQYPNAISTSYTGYSGPDSGKLLTIATRLTSKETTEFDKAAAIQDYLTGFKYSLKPHLPNSPHWLYDFLTKDKRGFCQQFAWAFAVLARLVDIPTRIAVGYTAGKNSDGTWTVTTRDAHAWPEVYFPSLGWLRFEPTPSGSGGQDTATIPAYAAGTVRGGNVAPVTTGGSTTQSGSRTPTGNPSVRPGGTNKLTPVGVNNGGLGTGPPKPGFPWPILIPVVIVLLLAFPGLGRVATRRRRWLAASGDIAVAHAAWREMTDDLTDYGFAGLPSESPRALARRLAKAASLDAPARDAVTRIGAAEERARYAISPRPSAGLRGDVRMARRAIADHASWSQRIRARLLPASTLLAIAHGLQRAGELFGWLDTSWPGIRREFRQSVRHGSEPAGW